MVVTGSSSGLGAALIKDFAARGFGVCIIFDADDSRVGINVTPLVPEVQGPDYVRLWAC